MREGVQPPAPTPMRRGPRPRVARSLQLSTWLGATFRVLGTRMWVWLPLGGLVLLVVAPVTQLYMPIYLLPFSWWWAGDVLWPYLLVSFIPPTLMAALAALLVPAALRGGRLPRGEAWGQAAIRLPLVYVAVVALTALTWLPFALFARGPLIALWLSLLGGFVLQVRCSLAPVILLAKRTGLVKGFRASVRLTRHHTFLLLNGHFLLAVVFVIVSLLLGRWTRFGVVTMSGHGRPVLIVSALVQSAYLAMYAFAAAVAWHDLDAPHRKREVDARAEVFD